MMHTLLSHPSIRGWLYVFVPVRKPPLPAADSCPHNNFWTTFRIFLNIFYRINDPDLYINWLDFGRFSSWPWPSIFKVKYGICFISAQNGPIAMKQKANITIEF